MSLKLSMVKQSLVVVILLFLAEVVEAAIIARQLERGRFPYCHVRRGNTASEALQRKLGLTFDENRTLYWLG